MTYYVLTAPSRPLYPGLVQQPRTAPSVDPPHSSASSRPPGSAHPTDAASTDSTHPAEPDYSKNPANPQVQNMSYSGASPHLELHDYAYIPTRKDTGALPPALDQLAPACQAVYSNEKNVVQIQKLLVPVRREHQYRTTVVNKYCIVALEQALLQMISRPGVCQSGVYMFSVRSAQNGSELTRIIESPRMTGFADSLEVPVFVEEKYRVYGPQEIGMRGEFQAGLRRKATAADAGPSKNRHGGSWVVGLRKIYREFQSVQEAVSKIDPASGIKVAMFIRLRRGHIVRDNDLACFTIGIDDQVKASMESAVENFMLNGTPATLPGAHDYRNLHSLQDGLNLLSCFSNYHWQSYLRSNGTESSESTNVGRNSFISVPPYYNEPKLIGLRGSRHLPSSARNRFIYFTVNKKFDKINQLVKFMFPTEGDSKRVAVHALETRPEEKVVVQSKSGLKRPRLSKTYRNGIVNQSGYTPDVFKEFCCHVLNCRKVWYQESSTSGAVFVLPELDDEGFPSMSKFSHACLMDGTLSCTCATMRAPQQSESSDKICLHLKLLRDYWVKPMDMDAPLTKLLREMVASEKKPATVDLSSYGGKQRFSVPSLTKGAAPAVLIVDNKSGMITCRHRKCRNRPEIRTFHSLKALVADPRTLGCEHMIVLKAYQDEWIHKYPQFNTMEITEPEMHEPEASDLAEMHELEPRDKMARESHAASVTFELVQDDLQDIFAHARSGDEAMVAEPQPTPQDIPDMLSIIIQSGRSESTGNLTSKSSKMDDNPPPQMTDNHSVSDTLSDATNCQNQTSFSDHVPLDRDDDRLIRATEKRTQITSLTYSRVDGALQWYDLEPAYTEQCLCGSGFSPSAPLIEAWRAVLYLRHTAVRCRVMKRPCLSGTCHSLYNGREQGLFFWSKTTIVPDEIGWDFVARVGSTMCTVSTFCEDMNRVYKSIDRESVHFLSRTPFTGYMQTWAAKLGLEEKLERLLMKNRSNHSIRAIKSKYKLVPKLKFNKKFKYF